MQKTITAPSEWLREIEVEIEPDQLKAKVNNVFDQYKDRISLPGFRPGKVPRHVLEKRLGPEMESSAVEELVEAAVHELVSESEFHIAAPPRITSLEVTQDKAIRFRISLEVIPDFELRPYVGIALRREEPAGFDAEFERRLQTLREKCATFHTVQRAAQVGDFVVVDYLTTIGDSVVGEERKNVMLEVGDKLAADEVNRALTGAKAGDERSADVSYPSDYSDKNLAGKTVTYRFRVRDVKERHLPDVSEELAHDLGFESLDALRIDINEEILADRERLSENGLKNQIFEYLTSEHQFEPPETWVKAALERLTRQYDLPDDSETRQRLLPVATKWAKFDCVVARIADKENISISDEEINSAIQALAEQSKTTVEEIARLIDNPVYRNQLLREKVLRFIRDRARIE